MTGQHGDLAPLSRLDWLWVVLPYVLLASSSIVAVVSEDVVDGELLQAGLLVVGLTLWHTWWITMHPRWLETRLVPMAIYFLGLVVMVHWLTALSFAFFPVYLVSYPMAFVALPGRWAYAGVGLTAAVDLLVPFPQSLPGSIVVLVIGGAVLVSVTGGTIRALETQTARRKAAMTELQRTHDDLERALAQNIQLQAQLQAEARQAGIAAERTRLAGEIHDTIAGGLTGILSQFEALSAELPGEHPLYHRIRLGTDLTRETLQEARRSVRALRPNALSDAPLPTALAQMIERFERNNMASATWEVTGAHQPLDQSVEDVLIRAAQEALTNINRHADATAVHLTLSYLGDTVMLDVVDNGTGYIADHIDPGHGLGIMQERVEALGGAVYLDTNPGDGTTLTVSMPLIQEPYHGSS